MKSKFLIILTILYAQNLWAIEYIQGWEEIKVSESFDFKKTILETNKCTKYKLQKKLFLNKNNLKELDDLYDRKTILIQTCHVDEKYSDEDLDISSWERYQIEKGFILSMKLQDRGCRNIFSKQIPQFHKKNKDLPPDVNLFDPGNTVLLQSCEIKPNIITVKTEVPLEKEELEKQSHRYQRLTNLSIGYNKDNKKDIFAIGVDLKFENFDLFITNSQESIIAQLKYNFFIRNNFAFFINTGARFSFEQQNNFNNTFAQAGFSFNFYKNKISIAQSLFADGDSISAKFEHQFNKQYGLFGEILKWDTLNKEYKGEVIFTGFQFFF